jgi:hypothetical protein
VDGGDDSGNINIAYGREEPHGVSGMVTYGRGNICGNLGEVTISSCD